MTEKPGPKPHQQQVYDSTLKALFQDQTEDMLSLLLGEVELAEAIDGEVIKSATLRTDRCYRFKRTKEAEKEELAHIELETAFDNDILPRMLEYYGLLYRKYRLPITPIVVYPFYIPSLPESELVIENEKGVILTLKVEVIALWQYQADTYLEQHKVGIYSLLPTMGGANYDILLQALEEMKAWHRDHPTQLASHLLWFSTFLQRTTIVSSIDKERIVRKMESGDSWLSLLDENPFVQRKQLEAEEKGLEEGLQKGLEKGLQEGLQKGLQEGLQKGLQEGLEKGLQEGRQEGREVGLQEGRQGGRAEGLQEAVVAVIGGRFPPLTELAHQKVARINKPELLSVLLRQVAAARDEDMARLLLDSFAA